MLADALEIPNLASRSSGYYGYLLRRYVLGIDTARSPVYAKGERRWFASYALAAYIYKLFILALILLFVFKISMLLGVVLGAWAIFGQIIQPLIRNLGRLLAETAAPARRRRGAVALVAVTAMAAVLTLVPLPQRSTAQGVVWLGEDGYVRTGTDCFIDRIIESPGSHVDTGAPLIACSDPLLEAQLQLAQARLSELQIKRKEQAREDRGKGQMADDDVRIAEANWQQ